MKSKIYKLRLMLIMSLVVVLAFTGCSTSNSNKFSIDFGKDPAAINELEPVTLSFYFWGTTKPDAREVLDEIEKHLNIRLDFKWLEWSSYFKTIKLMQSSDVDIDAFQCFAPNTLSIDFASMARNGMLMDITEMLPEYAPNLMEKFHEQLDSTRVDGKIYAVPSKFPIAYRNYAVVRKDLMDRYGIEKVETFEEYDTYLKTVRENEKSIIPGIISGYWNIFLGTGEYTLLDYVNRLVYKTNDREMKIMALEQTPEFRKGLEHVTNWNSKGYLMRLDHSEIGLWQYVCSLLNTGKVSSCIVPEQMCGETIMPAVNELTATLQKTIGNAEFAVYNMYPDKKFQRMSPLGDWYVSGCMAINARSQNPERTLMFLDWIQASQENYDLFMYGIEGKHYIINDNNFNLPENVNLHYSPYLNWSGRSSFMNVDFERMHFYDGDEAAKNQYLKNISDNTEYAPHEGFYADFTNIQDEVLIRPQLFSQLIDEEILHNGYNLDDFDKALKSLSDAGTEKIITELQGQLDYWRNNIK